MRTSINAGGVHRTAFFLALLAATPAYAGDGLHQSSVELSTTASLVSDYRFRGISYSSGDPAVQAEIAVSHNTGLYAGMWGSSLADDGSGFGSIELDFYAGWSGNLSPGITADANIVYYHYPARDSELAPATDSFEASLAFTLEGRIVEPTLGVSYAWKQAALEHQANTYLFLDTKADVPRTPITVTAHLGYTDGSYSIAEDGTNLDWSVAALWALTDQLSMRIEYVGVGGPAIKDVSDNSLVVTLAVEF